MLEEEETAFVRATKAEVKKALDNMCERAHRIAQGHTRDDPGFEEGGITTFSTEFPWDYELPELPDDETDLPFDNKEKKCKHEWKQHHGLIEIFEYCKHCDVRKDDTNN